MAVDEFEILIVGGGPAGISTWLHQNEISPELAARTLLLEKKIYPRPKLCGGGVTQAADHILARLGIYIDVPSVSIHAAEFRYRDICWYWRKRDLFRVVRRQEFDHELAKVAIKRGMALQEGEAPSRI